MKVPQHSGRSDSAMVELRALAAAKKVAAEQRVAEALAAAAEHEDFERRIGMIDDHAPDMTVPVARRIEAFLKTWTGHNFSPRELMIAVNGNEDATRKALTGLVTDGLITKTAHATYTFTSTASTRQPAR